MSTDSGYLLENAAPEAADRFDALAALLDDVTVGHLERLGVGHGWRCLDVGAGGGSIAGWLSRRVGPGGSVVATDIDTRWLERLAGPRLTVRRHDVAVDPLPEAEFDLVHARLVLVHVAQRTAALEAMVRALRPGGWLLVEEFASTLARGASLEGGPHAELADRIRHGVERLIDERGGDVGLGRTLPARFRTAGLVDVGADGHVVLTGGEAMTRLERANVNQVGAALVAAGVASAAELDRYLGLVDAGEITPILPPLVSCWGRRGTAAGAIDERLSH